MVTFTWHACKYKVHELHQKYILKEYLVCQVSYHRRLGSLLLSMSYRFWALINSLCVDSARALWASFCSRFLSFSGLQDSIHTVKVVHSNKNKMLFAVGNIISFFAYYYSIQKQTSYVSTRSDQTVTNLISFSHANVGRWSWGTALSETCGENDQTCSGQFTSGWCQAGVLFKLVGPQVHGSVNRPEGRQDARTVFFT